LETYSKAKPKISRAVPAKPGGEKAKESGGKSEKIQGGKGEKMEMCDPRNQQWRAYGTCRLRYFLSADGKEKKSGYEVSVSRSTARQPPLSIIVCYSNACFLWNKTFEYNGCASRMDGG